MCVKRDVPRRLACCRGETCSKQLLRNKISSSVAAVLTFLPGWQQATLTPQRRWEQQHCQWRWGGVKLESQHRKQKHNRNCVVSCCPGNNCVKPLLWQCINVILSIEVRDTGSFLNVGLSQHLNSKEFQNTSMCTCIPTDLHDSCRKLKCHCHGTLQSIMPYRCILKVSKHGFPSVLVA